MSTHAAAPRPIPVVIVAGFLGSGKTTLMRRLISQAHGRGLRCAVIVNEFGQLDVDAAILRQEFDRKTSLDKEKSRDEAARGAPSSFDASSAASSSFAALFADDLVASLAGGCACCTGRDELHETLLELASRPIAQETLVDEGSPAGGLAAPSVANADVLAAREEDENASRFSEADVLLARPDVILMEASGLADPITLLEVISAPDLLPLVRVAMLVGVVDAARFGELPRDLAPLLRRQLQLADVLILNKADLIEKSRLEEVEAQIRGFNHQAQLERTSHALLQIDIWKSLLGQNTPRTPQIKPQATAHLPSATAPASVTLAASDDIPGGEEITGEAAHASGHAKNTSHTLICALPHPVDRARLESALEKLPDDVWRVKGFVQLRGESGWFLLQYTGSAGGGRFQLAPFFLMAGTLEPTSALVFIGGALDHDTLRRAFGSGALGALW